MRQLTGQEARSIYDSGVWRDWDDEAVVRFQLFQRRLCVPFSCFHDAIEQVLGRPVFTHEFACVEELIKEYIKQKPPPTFDEILAMIPVDKRIVVVMS